MARNGYPIKTPAFHRAELARQADDNHRRLDYDVSDVGLSSWASGQLMSYHHAALEALALGAVHGIAGPAVEADFLMDGDGNVVAYEKVWKAFERQPPKQMWRLPRAQAERLGRWNIPAGEKSRVQKQLGLREAHAIVPAEREVRIEFDYSKGGYRPDIVYVIRPL